MRGGEHAVKDEKDNSEGIYTSIYRGAIARGLRNEGAVTGAIETPAMIHALQPAPLVNAALRERSQSVRTRVIKDLPSGLVAVPPHHHVNAQYLLGVGSPLVKVAQRHHRVPLCIPVELLGGAFYFGLLHRWAAAELCCGR